MTARTTQDASPDKKVTISFQLPNQYAQIIHEAAEHVLQRDNGTAAYCRQLVLDAACDDLGRPRIDIGLMDLPTDGISRAAKAKGMTVNAFIAAASRQAALDILRDLEPSTPPRSAAHLPPPPLPPASRRRSPSGSLAKQGATAAPPHTTKRRGSQG